MVVSGRRRTHDVQRNRVAIVTGASRGLGGVIAGVLADARLRPRDRRAATRPLLEAAAQSLRRAASRVVAVAGDVTDAAVRARLVDAARELGGLDVLVNNASELGAIGPLMRLRRTALRARLPGQRRRADRADSARRAAARRTPGAHREHHERCGAAAPIPAGDRTAPARPRSSC